MSERIRQGKLLAIGGAADICINTFIELAGGIDDACILVIPHASEDAEVNGKWLVEEFRKMGCKRVNLILPAEPFAIPRGTTGIYMMGGDQSRLVKLLGTRGKRALQRYHRRGGFIAGSSAGAAGQSRYMVADGMADHKLVEGSLVTGFGLGLVRKMVIDTHFMERNRYNRMMAYQALLKDGILAVGLDEDTGIIIDGDVATVVGAGCANFFVPKKVFVARHDQPHGKPRKLSVGQVMVSFLSEGCTFNLRTGAIRLVSKAGKGGSHARQTPPRPQAAVAGSGSRSYDV